MARKTPTISQEESYLQPDEPVREELDDARLLDLDAEEESPFLRGQRRVPVRRGALPRRTANRLRIATFWGASVGLVLLLAWFIYGYGARSWRFRLESSGDIQLSGLQHVSK